MRRNEVGQIDVELLPNVLAKLELDVRALVDELLVDRLHVVVEGLQVVVGRALGEDSTEAPIVRHVDVDQVVLVRVIRFLGIELTAEHEQETGEDHTRRFHC